MIIQMSLFLKQHILYYYIGTKCDLRSVKEFDCVKDSEAVKLVKNLKLKGYVECASKTNNQVKEVGFGLMMQQNYYRYAVSLIFPPNFYQNDRIQKMSMDTNKEMFAIQRHLISGFRNCPESCSKPERDENIK